ncbi:MAG: sulfurtransferase TusA family protein [Deltaproteobacteria bacterium]|jgi:TusA-related sulfurtransferase|nr:sulfurtransferase TusA family protein [Deltaproteobacteria bacterium]
MTSKGEGKRYVVDTTGSVCPMTFVLAKMAIDEIDDGEEISIRLNEGEALANVPRSIKEEGHKILKLLDNGDGTYDLIVRKVEGDSGPQ